MFWLNKNKVEFFDTSSLFKAGFYLNGFHLHGKEAGYRLSVKQRVPSHLRDAVDNVDWRFTLFTSCLFRTSINGKDTCFCIDTHDLNDIKKVNGKNQGYHLPLLEKVDAYFKVNYNRERIENNPDLRDHQHKIIPANQFIPLKPPTVLPFLFWPPPTMGGYESNGAHENIFWRTRERIRHLKNWVTLDELTAYRLIPKDLDVFFVTSYRVQDRHSEDMAARLRLVEGIRGLSGVKSLTGLANYKPLPDEFEKYRVKSMQQADYLKNLARARIVVYTSGVDECLASKFALFQALGVCIVGRTVNNNTDVIYGAPHLKEQFAFSTTESMVSRIEELVKDREKTDELAVKNVEYFDRHLSPAATAQQIIRTLETRLS